MARGKKPNRNVKKNFFASNHTLKILKSSCIKRKNILIFMSIISKITNSVENICLCNLLYLLHSFL